MGDSGESLTFDLGTPVLNKPIKRDNTKQKKWMFIQLIHIGKNKQIIGPLSLSSTTCYLIRISIAHWCLKISSSVLLGQLPYNINKTKEEKIENRKK